MKSWNKKKHGKQMGTVLAIVSVAGMVLTATGGGNAAAAVPNPEMRSVVNKATVLYVSNQLAYAHAYKVKMDRSAVMVASIEDAASMLDLVQKKYNDDDSYSVRLIPDAAEGERYKTAILPVGKKQNEQLASVAFRQDVTVEPVSAELSKILTVKEAVDKVTDKEDRMLSVVTKEKADYRETYQKKVKYIKTDRLYEGQKKVKSKGKKGLRDVSALITYINGKEKGRKILEQDVIKKAVAKKVLVGTKKAESFIPPMEQLTLSSSFGSRWGRQHSGTDFSTPVGTKVFASRDGKVTYASWMSGYGYCVLIRHADGYQTRYAHLSSIKVSVGQKVSQGQLIALSGNTGNSTGPHLHFEVIKNGTAVNAMNYIR